jgi:wyosine [tRNA(Phe)-imidazoG37] synthetase (radical SAM superfamily)
MFEFQYYVGAPLKAADAIMPTLVAGATSLYRAITRPWPVLAFERLVEGLVAFRRLHRQAVG